MKQVVLVVIALSLLASCSDRAPDKTDRKGVASASPKEPSVAEKSRPSTNGPFGIEMGEKLEALGLKERDRTPETGISVVTDPPKPSSQFEMVAVVSYPETGICEIRALSKIFDSDPSGVVVRGNVDAIAESLETRYGKSKKHDVCSGYSCNPEFWLQQLQSSERAYGYSWTSSAGKPLPNHVASIEAYAQHAQYNDSRMRVDYEFDNKAACKIASKHAASANL